MYHTVARVGEIAQGRGIPVEIEGQVIAVFLDEGNYYAIDDACPHKGAPLCDGIVFDRIGHLHLARLAIQPGRRPMDRQPRRSEPRRDLSRASRRRPDPGRRGLNRERGRETADSACSAANRNRGEFLTMRAAYIEETGPPEVIKVGELPEPRAGPRAGARQGPRSRAQPDRPLPPVGAWSRCRWPFPT